VTRLLLGLASLPLLGYGGWLLLSRQDADQVLDVALWLGAGVVAHDVLVAGVALGVGALVGLLPTASRAPAAVGLVVLGTLGLTAVPVLGRFGEVAGNDTHLDRPYVTAWLVLVTVGVVAVVAAAVVRAQKEKD
jgi:hypothetical protein